MCGKTQQLWRVGGLAVVVIMGGCSGPQSHEHKSVLPPQRVSAPELPEAGCELVLDEDGVLLLDGAPTGFGDVIEKDVSRWNKWGIVTFVMGEAALLVGQDNPWNGFKPDTNGRLYRLDCASGTFELFFEDPGADFSSAILAPTGHTLYYGHTPGLAVLDLEEVVSTPLTSPPLFPPEGCHANMDPIPAKDLPRELSEEGLTLLFERGGWCGPDEGSWATLAMTLELEEAWGDEALGVTPVRRISHVVVGANDVIWLADWSPACHLDGYSEVMTRGLWRSEDAAETWQLVEVRTIYGAVRVIAADVVRPDHLAVLAGTCDNSYGEGPFGGDLHITRDGETWTAVRMDDLPFPDGVDEDVWDEPDDLAFVDGDFFHMVLMINGVSFESTDGGEHWTHIPSWPETGEAAKELSDLGLELEADTLRDTLTSEARFPAGAPLQEYVLDIVAFLMEGDFDNDEYVLEILSNGPFAVDHTCAVAPCPEPDAEVLLEADAFARWLDDEGVVFEVGELAQCDARCCTFDEPPTTTGLVITEMCLRLDVYMPHITSLSLRDHRALE